MCKKVEVDYEESCPDCQVAEAEYEQDMADFRWHEGRIKDGKAVTSYEAERQEINDLRSWEREKNRRDYDPI